MQHALVEQGESRPARAHALDQLKLISLFFNDSVAFGPRQARSHYRFLSDAGFLAALCTTLFLSFSRCTTCE